MAARKRRHSLWVVVVAGIAIAAILVPFAGLLYAAPWSTLRHQLSTPVARDALMLSLGCSAAATALSIVFGLPLAWILGRHNFRGRNIIQTIVTVPMVMPPVVAGVALLGAFSRDGLVGRPVFHVFGIQLTYRAAGVVIAESFVAMPFLIITMAGAFASMNPRFEEVAEDLGAPRWRVARVVILPAVAPALIAGIALTWARALGEFGATLTFAGNIQGRTQTLPLAIELALQDDPGVAVALSLVLLAVSIVILFALRSRWLGTLTGWHT